ncbi:MAG: DUF502 domain-containing protein [Bacteroidia bacterium]|nr:DUF502 domain-containing protein [Bacteroidia bacterium]
MKRYFQYFFQGLLYTVPIAVTIWVLVWSVNATDRLFKWLGEDTWLDFPGRGILLILIFVSIVGYYVPKLVTPSISSWWKEAMKKMPFVGMIYTSVKDLMEAFVGKQSKFNSPVLVCLDKDNIQHRLGFITNEDLSIIGIPGNKVAVVFPISYGMFGEMIIVPADKVQKLDASASDVMKFIVSGGIIKIDEKEN